MSTDQRIPPPPQAEEKPATYAQLPSPPSLPPPMPRPAFSLANLLGRWQAVLLHPGMEQMDAQRQGSNWPTIWYSLLGLALVQAIVAVFQRVEVLSWNTLASSPQFVQYLRSIGVRNVAQLNPGTSALEAFIGAFIGFFLMAGLVYLVAKALGGTGSFLEHTYLLALIYVPLEIIASVAGLIPVLGGLIGAAAAIYMIVLVVMAISSAHQLTIGTSIVVVILPAILTVLLVVLLAVIIAIVVAGILLLLHVGA
jgi:hypothetical protein